MRLAQVMDLLQWVIYAVYSSQGGKPHKPQPTMRPGVPPSGVNAVLSAEDRAYLEDIRERNRAERVRVGVEQPAGPVVLSESALARLEQIKQQRRSE